MYVIVGLGNPGKQYEGTRHNMGFDVIDQLIDDHGIALAGRKFHSLYGTGRIGGERVILAKPLTYMNLSGTAVRELVDYYKIDPERELIVLSDDITLAPGWIRIRKKGSAGGQNGLKHIIAQLGTDGFSRVRVGTGEKPKGWDLADWVLGHFSKEDRKMADLGIERAAKAVEEIIAAGPDSAMNLYNGAPDLLK